jgi:SAM-dependent methyltransferase
VIDALTSPTLKHLREQWWDDNFTGFLAETLKPRPGNRILDVGCGEGLAEVSIGGLQISQIRLVGIDLVPAKVAEARRALADHNRRAAFAAGDARRLPFATGAFDSIFCVAVLQHIGDISTAVAELARVTRLGGRVVAVEPDNSARYFFSSVPSGERAFATARRFFAALSESRGESTEPAVGPRLPVLFGSHGIEPLGVRLFPVSHAQLGAPAAAVWADRRRAVEQPLAEARDARVRTYGDEHLETLRAYEAEASRAGKAFVELQNTMLFATSGQRRG